MEPPFVGVAVKVTDTPELLGLVPAVIAMDTDGATDGFTVIVMLLLVAVLTVAQARLEVITQETTWPLVSAVVVYVELFVPTLEPLTFHWYAGAEPPFMGVAVKVAEAPAHVGLLPVVWAMATAGVAAALMVIVTAFDVAGLPVTPERFDVITHETTWPFVSDELLYVLELVPTFAPFTFHW